MQSGNNIHVQQHKTNMINEKWIKTRNDAPFVAFYDMRAVTFVLPDEMADVLNLLNELSNISCLYSVKLFRLTLYHTGEIKDCQIIDANSVPL